MPTSIFIFFPLDTKVPPGTPRYLFLLVPPGPSRDDMPSPRKCKQDPQVLHLSGGFMGGSCRHFWWFLLHVDPPATRFECAASLCKNTSTAHSQISQQRSFYMEKIPGWTLWSVERGVELGGRTSHTWTTLLEYVFNWSPQNCLCWFDSCGSQQKCLLMACNNNIHLWLATITQRTFKIATLNRFCTRIGSPCLRQ